MANVGTAPAGKTLIGQGDTTSSKFADIGTDSGLTEHGVLLAQGSSAFTATSVGVDGSLLIGATGADPAMALPTSINDTVTFHPSANGLGFEDRRWLTAFVVDPSASVGERGTYQTIQAAIDAASSGTQIVIREGTYIEDPVMKAGIQLTALCGSAENGTVTIVGKINCAYSGTSSISNIRLQTNGDHAIEFTGSNTCVLNVDRCYLNISNANVIDSANANATLNFTYGFGEFTGTGIKLLNSTGGALNFYYSQFLNTAGNTAASTWSGGSVLLWGCQAQHKFFSSGTAVLNMRYAQLFSTNDKLMTLGGSGNHDIFNCMFTSGTATAISVNTTVQMHNSYVNTSNANAIDGSGTLIYSHITFRNSGVISTSTTTPTNVDSGPISFDDGTNSLDHYSTGTFTPTIIGSTAAGTGTYTTQLGRYTRIGRRVFFNAYVVWTAHTGTGFMYVGGLPFTSSATANNFNALAVWASSLTFAGQLTAYVEVNQTRAILQRFATGGAAGTVNIDTAASLMLTGSYQV